ncbi:MAG TPA: thioesterase family protein [Solirubrobacterales bacterium]|nr:thioesterase family protein [Solirubrobacterales bacterium]
MTPPFVHGFRIRYGECDPQGIVFNANYVAFVDHAFTELWREAFGSYQSMVDRGIDMVVAELNLAFLGSARFDDLVEIRATIERLGTTSMTTRLELARGDESLVEARIRHVFVETATWSKTPLPAWLREGLAPYVAAPLGKQAKK